jgi:hypothetical protein
MGLLLAASCTDPKAASEAAAKARAAARIPVPAAELKQLIPGHFIDERPYPCDAGPLMLQADGKFIAASGWGDTEGRYAISDGVISFDGYRSNSGDPHVTFSMKLNKDGNGAIYRRGPDDPDVEFPLKLAPIDKNTRWITCGNEKAPPPPPGY